MTDEFPSLEVALAASVLLLMWRGWLLYRSRINVQTAAERLLRIFAHGTPNARELAGANLGPLVEPLARAALVAQADETERAISERSKRVRRQVRSAAARDLVIAAVLGSAVLYAFFARTVVGAVFYGLGAAATVLLVSAIVERVRIDRELARVAVRFSAAVRGSSREASIRDARSCRACGAPYRDHLESRDAIGDRLWELGAREILICGRCGAISGKALTTRSRPPPAV